MKSTSCNLDINVHLDNQQDILNYLKNTEVNLNNILIITRNFNIRNNDWDLLYSYYLSYTDILQEVELLTPINPVPTKYADNFQGLNSVLDLMFLRTVLEELNNYIISLDFRSPSDHVLLSQRKNLFKKKNNLLLGTVIKNLEQIFEISQYY